MANHPERIICLSPETTEVLYLLEEEDRIVGISGYTVRPPRARREKPRVAAFTTAQIDEILALRPDLVLGFSDLQTGIAAELLKRGVEIHMFNQRSVKGILTMILTVGSLAGAAEKAANLVQTLEVSIERARRQSMNLTRKPIIYFEEWYDPVISGVGWVSDLIEISGGTDCFPEFAKEPAAVNRIVRDPQDVVLRKPDIIIGSWCGKKFHPEKVCQRPGWDEIPAVREGQVYEIKSAYILQPGPVAITEGLSRVQRIVAKWVNSRA
jgi:iron complex transport system substrate-binding protein